MSHDHRRAIVTHHPDGTTTLTSPPKPDLGPPPKPGPDGLYDSLEAITQRYLGTRHPEHWTYCPHLNPRITEDMLPYYRRKLLGSAGAGLFNTDSQRGYGSHQRTNQTKVPTKGSPE